MKKLFLIMSILAFTLVGFSQPNKTLTVAVDTIQGAETVNFGAIKITSTVGYLTIQALCTQTGGTSDGSLILQGSVDGTTYTTLQATDNLFYAYPNDTLTITNGASYQAILKDAPFQYYRIQGAGTANDTTKVTIKYIYRTK